ncbi:MAG: hypothetical protein ACR2MP_32965 [Streptosporangiaceae bacterium]
MATPEPTIWGLRAERLIAEALYLVRTDEVFVQLSAAIKCLEIDAGEDDPAELGRLPVP